jgi:hypothetical protein
MNEKRTIGYVLLGILCLCFFGAGVAAGIAIQRYNPAWLNKSGGYYYSKQGLQLASAKGDTATQDIKSELAKSEQTIADQQSTINQQSKRLDDAGKWIKLAINGSASGIDQIEALRVAVEVVSNPKYDPGISPDTYINILNGKAIGEQDAAGATSNTTPAR